VKLGESIMRTILLLCCVVALFATVSATTGNWTRSKEVAPIIGAPAAGLKKPIIYTPPAPRHAPKTDSPLTGAPPANLKKVNVTENLYGGSIEWRRGKDGNGCPCREKVGNFRYDAQFKPRRFNRTGRWNRTRCGCNKPTAAPSPLPPIIARLKKRAYNGTRHNRTCHKPKPKPVEKVVPLYYPKKNKKHRKHHKKPCNATTPVKPPTIQPQFYPTWAERRARRKSRRAARKAAGKKK